MIEVLDVDANPTRPQDALDSELDILDGGTITAHNVDGQRDGNLASDPPDRRQEFALWHRFAVRVSERDHEARAGSRDRRKAGVLEDPRARDIPGIREDEDPLAVVEGTKLLGLVALEIHGRGTDVQWKKIGSGASVPGSSVLTRRAPTSANGCQLSANERFEN